jgi:hypothetical protein
MKITLAAVALALLFCGVLAVSGCKPEAAATGSDEKKRKAEGPKPKA